MAKLLVTGATGFVGAWLTKKLLELEHDVHILVRANSDLSDLPTNRLTVHTGDVTELNSLRQSTAGMEAVFHLAGVVGYSKKQRPLMQAVNIEGTNNVITACVENQVGRLVYMSSVVAIGASFDGSEPLNESSSYNLKKYNLGYFETKRIAETNVIAAYSNHNLDCVILCPSTIYGPGDAKKGSRGAQLKVAKGKFPFYTSGGVSIVSVQDVVDATIKAWKVGRSGERYILSGENITIQRLFELIASEAEVKPPHIFLPNPVVWSIGKAGDLLEFFGRKGPLNSENAIASTLFHWFSHDKANKELGFAPKDAKSCIQESVQWSKDNGLI